MPIKLILPPKLTTNNVKDLIRKEVARIVGNSDTGSPFVDPQRIDELSSINSDDFDFTKLISLCEELNIAYASGSYYAVAMLGRAVQDHIPPIFAAVDFNAAANNYGGGKSFKASMNNLRNSLRNIANAYLHEQIRSKECSSSKVSVGFSQDLDVLLAEIIRISKS